MSDRLYPSLWGSPPISLIFWGQPNPNLIFWGQTKIERLYNQLFHSNYNPKGSVTKREKCEL